MKKVVVALSFVALFLATASFNTSIPDDLVIGIYQEDQFCNMELKDDVVEIQKGEFMLQVNVSKEIKDAKVYIQASYSDDFFNKEASQLSANDLTVRQTIKSRKYFKKRNNELMVDTKNAVEIIDYKPQFGLFYRINDVVYNAQQKTIEKIVDAEGNEIDISAVDKDIYLLVIVEGKKGKSSTEQEISRKKVLLKWKG